MKLHVGQAQLETMQQPKNLKNTKLKKKCLDLNLDEIRLDVIGPSAYSSTDRNQTDTKEPTYIYKGHNWFIPVEAVIPSEQKQYSLYFA